MLGGARLSNEDAYAWAKLAKSVIGTDSVDAQLGDGLPAEVVLGLPRATIDEACSAAVRGGAVGRPPRGAARPLPAPARARRSTGGLEVVELAPRPASLAAYRHRVARLPPRRGAALGPGARASGTAPRLGGRRRLGRGAWERSRAPAEGEGSWSSLGRPSLAEDGALVADAAAAMAEAWPAARFLPALRRGNVMGALDMGLAPGLLPGRVALDEGRDWLRGGLGIGARRAGPRRRGHAGRPGRRVDGGAGAGGGRPGGRLPRRGPWPHEALGRAGLRGGGGRLPVAVGGCWPTWCCPVAIVHERTGTTTNIEGRVTRLGQKLVAPGQCWPDWMIAAELAERLGRRPGGRRASPSCGTRSSAWPPPTPGSPGPCSTAPRRATGSSPLWPRRRCGPRAAGVAGAVRPHGHARDRRRRGPGCPAVRAWPSPRGDELAAWTARRGDRLRRRGTAVGSPAGTRVLGWPRSLRWSVPALPAAPTATRCGWSSARRLYDRGVLLGACASLAALGPAPRCAGQSARPGRTRACGHRRGCGSAPRDVRWCSRPCRRRRHPGCGGIDFNLDGDDARRRPASPALIDGRQPVVDVRWRPVMAGLLRRP